MNTKDFSGLMAFILIIVQAIFLFLDNAIMVYILMLAICIALRFNWEEKFKEKYGLK